MSTKTTFKRIALVAVASLGLGVISVAPSSATPDATLHSLAFTAGGTSASASIAAGESATVSFKTSFVASTDALDSVTVKAQLVDGPSLSTVVNLDVTDSATSSGVVGFSTSDQVSGTTGVVVRTGAASATNNATINATLYAPTKAGTYTVRIVDYAMTLGSAAAWSPAITPLTFTITVTAVSTTAAANSVSYIRSDAALYADGTAATDSAVVTAKVATTKTTDTTQEATIYVFEKNATSSANESLTVSVDGPAYVTDTTATRNSTGAKYITAKYDSTATTTGSPLYVYSDGNAGTATITIKTISGQLIGTKTVKFFGNVTTLTASTDPKPRTIVRAGGKTLASAWAVKATDAASQPVKGLTLTCVSSDALVITSSCDFTDNADGTYTVGLTSATGSVSGKTANITIRVVDPAVTTSTAYITAAAVAVTTGSSVDKVTITTDKTSYAAGEQMIVTVKAVDSLGNPVYDGAALAALSSNKSVTGLSNVATAFAAGTADSISRDTDGTVLSTYRVFAPASGGSFDIYLDYVNVALATVRATATATVVDGAATAADAATDAANEATDAANAATDAALAAADAADAATAAAQDASDAVAALSATVAKLVASLKAQITSLTNLVIKIQKKVKA